MTIMMDLPLVEAFGLRQLLSATEISLTSASPTLASSYNSLACIVTLGVLCMCAYTVASSCYIDRRPH